MRFVTPARRRWVSNDYITRVKTGSQQLEIRWVGEKMLGWGTCPREAGPPGPRLSSPGERERNTVMANRVGVNMLQFCSVSISVSHTTLSIKWEVYFSKELCRSSLLCRRYDSAYRCICVCIVGHGYTTIGSNSPSQSGPGSNSNEGIFHIPESSKTGVSSLNCLMSYLGHSLGVKSYLLAE